LSVCCTDSNTHNPGDSPIVGHVTRAGVDLQPKEVGECLILVSMHNYKRV